MRDSRKLEDPSPAQPEDAGSEETRGLSVRLKGTMHGPYPCEFAVIETPETSVSGVFVCALLFGGALSRGQAGSARMDRRRGAKRPAMANWIPPKVELTIGRRET